MRDTLIVVVMPDPFNVANRELIISLAARYGVPAIYFQRFFPESVSPWGEPALL